MSDQLEFFASGISPFHLRYVPPPAAVQRDVALAHAAAAADPEWMAKALNATMDLARAGEFTTDEVWFALEQAGIPPPREPRALGPIIMGLVRRGAIVDTGRQRHSKRRHAARIPVYTLSGIQPDKQTGAE
jgi:hypothetical protein